MCFGVRLSEDVQEILQDVERGSDGLDVGGVDEEGLERG